MTRTPTIETELGIERLCWRCGEWWPFDEEFWYFHQAKGERRRKVQGPCRACWSERIRVQGRRTWIMTTNQP